MITSAAAAASATGRTSSPAAVARAHELPAGPQADDDLAPLSLRLRAWAWPWLP